MNGISGNIRIKHGVSSDNEHLQADFDFGGMLPNWSITKNVEPGSSVPQAVAAFLRSVADTLEAAPFASREEAETYRRALVAVGWNVNSVKPTIVGTWFFYVREACATVTNREQATKLLERAARGVFQ